MGLQLVLISVTLNDLERRNGLNFIIIFATWTIPETTEDDSHGVTVVTLLQDLARR